MLNYNHRTTKGFTLAELLIVVAIIGVLVGIAIPVFSGQLEKARGAVCQSNRRNLLSCYTVDILTGSQTAGDKAAVETALSQAGMTGTVTGASSPFTITGVCVSGGVVTAECGEDGSISITCSIHNDSIDAAYASGAATQSNAFIPALNDWLETNPTLTSAEKGEFYADYYSDPAHAAVPMSDAYKQKLVEAGLNKTLTSPLYWWTYPVTDSAGKLLYTVTYANKESDTAKWTNGNRGNMNVGYVVIVNGKTYMRTNQGKTVEPGNSNNQYQTENDLENALKANGYIVV